MSGRELAMWRVTHNYSQLELAQEMGVSKRTIASWEAEPLFPLPRYVQLALKGLLFMHNDTCRCSRCGGNPGRYSEVAKRAYDPSSRKTS